MPELDLKVTPDERIEDFAFELRAIGERAEHLKPVLEEIVTLVLQRERRLFETRGATGGRFWRPLKGSTVERRKRERPPPPDLFAPLRLTDRLMKSLSERGHPDQMLNIQDDGFEFGTNVPYAQYHNERTGRPPLVIPKKHAEQYIKMINDFIYGENA